MTFSGLELSAILKMAKEIVLADLKVTSEEKSIVNLELQKFGVSSKQVAMFVTAAQTMEHADAVKIITAMTNEQKKYVTGYLAAVMACDGIDEAEIKIWRMISSLCALPTMTIAEAIEFWVNH